MLGKLWCALADYYTRQGNFEKARDIYEEAIETVMTVRDFSQVFEVRSRLAAVVTWQAGLRWRL